MTESLREHYDVEAAMDDLENYHAYLGTERGKEAYARVLVKLPTEVRDFALDECFVVCVGHDITGMAWPPSMMDNERSLIVCIERPDLEDGIAHEIAHARRGDYAHTIEIEKATDDLAVEWGFRRSYKSGYHPL